VKKVQEKELKWLKPLASRRIKMYRKAQEQETAPENFELPFEGIFMAIFPNNLFFL
jgi:hypothetical protein